MGLGLVSVAADLGTDARRTVLADSSAAIGICRRAGIGRVRHLAVGQLWVQERVRTGDFELRKHPGSLNPADILTKPVNAELVNRHVAAAGLHWEEGRPATAPSWTASPGARPRLHRPAVRGRPAAPPSGTTGSRVCLRTR